MEHVIDRRRAERHPCNLEAYVIAPLAKEPIGCTVTDISYYGTFVRIEDKIFIPAKFDLVIGTNTLPRPCRMTRRETSGFGVEFLEPVRHEIEEILSEYAFKEELMLEALSPSLRGEATLTKIRLLQAVNAIMRMIEGRNAMSWQYADAEPYRVEHMHKALRFAHEVMSHPPAARLPAPTSKEEQDRRVIGL